jgi:tetratricopeptide (TPR) repeat protein
VTGVALAPSGGLLALSQSDGELLQFQVEASSLLAGSAGAAPEEELRRAQALEEAGKPAEAREALLRALAADPGCLSACDALIALDDHQRTVALEEADRLAEAGQFAEALARLETARAWAPGDSELPRRWTAIVGGAESRLAAEAAAAEDRGEPAEAAGRWRALLQLDPKRRHAREEVARLSGLIAAQLVREGEAAITAGRDEAALAAWRKAQATAPSEALAARIQELELQRYLHAGTALYAQGRFPEAAFQLRKALVLQPGHPEALRYLAYIENTGAQSPLSERFSRLE